MAILPILCYPDPRLHTVARPVRGVDDRIHQLTQDMLETMYDAHGIGLAAPVRRILIDWKTGATARVPSIGQPTWLACSGAIRKGPGWSKPLRLWSSQEMLVGDEGCLSVPGIYDGVERAAAVRVRALDARGEAITVEAQEVLAVCIQHEMDHLLGKVFVEYLSPLKRNRIKTKMRKAQREDAR